MREQIIKTLKDAGEVYLMAAARNCRGDIPYQEHLNDGVRLLTAVKLIEELNLFAIPQPAEKQEPCEFESETEAFDRIIAVLEPLINDSLAGDLATGLISCMVAGKENRLFYVYEEPPGRCISNDKGAFE